MAAPPSERLFITGLPADFDQKKVEDVFGAYGTLSATKFIPGQGKHSALVTYGSTDEATWLVDNLNGNIPQGMDDPVTIKYANAPGGAKGGSWGGKDGGGAKGGFAKGGFAKGGGKDGGKDGVTLAGFGADDLVKGLSQAGALPGGKWSNDKNAVFVSGLPADTTDLHLYNMFSPFGAIPCKGVKVMCLEDGSCKGFGFVNFVDEEPFRMAVETLNGTGMPGGKFLTVKECKPQGSGKGKGGKGKE